MLSPTVTIDNDQYCRDDKGAILKWSGSKFIERKFDASIPGDKMLRNKINAEITLLEDVAQMSNKINFLRSKGIRA